MANTQSMCTSFMSELMTATHNFGTAPTRGSGTADTFKAALYLASATVNASTTVYSSTGEVTGTGYTAGGVTVTNATPPASTNTSATAGTAYWTPSASKETTKTTKDTKEGWQQGHSSFSCSSYLRGCPHLFCSDLEGSGAGRVILRRRPELR